ncbi:hypothetical protein ACRZ5S_22515 (plasmid) [Vibrio scophthalmi]|uniref:hypothetical protein n=1 Tax=Vibrio scophthalmi TaxID=45658 RepID=UPI003EBBA6CE
MTNFMTVVFKYENDAEFPKNITRAFMGNGEFEDVEITAVSCEDEISRLEKFEQE